MNKKVLTFFMMTLFILGPVSILQGQEEPSYAMWESMYITPDNTKLKALGEAMSKHNKKYHNKIRYNNQLSAGNGKRRKGTGRHDT